MKYFKNTSNKVFAYESDGSQDYYIKPDLIEMTAVEVEAHINPPKTIEQLKSEAKALQLATLEALTVTTSIGNIFDANNQARLDMLSAINSSDFLGATETKWRLADNSEVLIQLSELKEALALAIQAYANVKNIGA